MPKNRELYDFCVFVIFVVIVVFLLCIQYYSWGVDYSPGCEWLSMWSHHHNCAVNSCHMLQTVPCRVTSNWVLQKHRVSIDEHTNKILYFPPPPPPPISSQPSTGLPCLPVCSCFTFTKLLLTYSVPLQHHFTGLCCSWLDFSVSGMSCCE